jgi:hypothetical protein
MLVAAAFVFGSQHAEEEAVYRMLSLSQRSLTSDRPLPLRLRLDAVTQPSGASARGNKTTALVVDADGHPIAISPWAARYAEAEQAATQLDTHLDPIFLDVARSLDSGQFAAAREHLQQLCLGGQAIARASQMTPLQNGTVAGSRSPSDAELLGHWVSDCVTLLQYVPELPPGREDHKRLLMLLHDLGGALFLLHAMGGLSAPVLGVQPLARLGGMLGSNFGEWNRKTALTRALGDAERSGSASVQSQAVALLGEHGHCSASSPRRGAQHDGAGDRGSDGGDDETASDMWAQVGVRACATLLLRARRVGEALRLLRAVIEPASTLHPFLSAFELGSRLRIPAPSSREASAAPVRFSQEQMLEVLEGAIEKPQHGLASEANLLRWHLRTSLEWGQAVQSRPPLSCPDPQPLPRLAAPRILIAMPFVASEQARVSANLHSWRRGGGVAPCGDSSAAGYGSGDEATPLVDFMLYHAGRPGPGTSWFEPPEKLMDASIASCFRRVFVRHANLTAAEQYYIGGWDNTGPNNLFYRLFLDPELHSGNHDAVLWMESDMVPVQPNWLSRLEEEASAPRGFWRKGPQQQPRLEHAMISTHHYHMNSAGLYRLGQPCFVELYRRVAEEYPRQPHDVSTHLFLHDPRHFHIWQRHAHRFHYTDLVQNRLDEWSLEEVRRVSPDTVFVHGKYRKEAKSANRRAS